MANLSSNSIAKYGVEATVLGVVASLALYGVNLLAISVSGGRLQISTDIFSAVKAIQGGNYPAGVLLVVGVIILGFGILLANKIAPPVVKYVNGVFKLRITPFKPGLRAVVAAIRIRVYVYPGSVV